MTHFQALVLPPAMLLVVWLVARWNIRRHEAGPSPALVTYVWYAVKRLVGRDGDGDGDGDVDGDEPDLILDDRVAYYEDVPESPNRTHVRWEPRSVVPVPTADAAPARSELDRWIADCLDAGVNYATIVREGAAKFPASRSTIERAIRRVRAEC